MGQGESRDDDARAREWLGAMEELADSGGQSPQALRVPRLCKQTLYIGKGASGNLCDLSSGKFAPAFIVHRHQDGSPMCTQFCLPVQNSFVLKQVLKANIGLCCMQGPGFNDFQGSLNENIPGVMEIRAWQYDEGESAF